MAKNKTIKQLLYKIEGLKRMIKRKIKRKNKRILNIAYRERQKAIDREIDEF